MKKLLSIVLVVALLLSFSACGSKKFVAEDFVKDVLAVKTADGEDALIYAEESTKENALMNFGLAEEDVNAVYYVCSEMFIGVGSDLLVVEPSSGKSETVMKALRDYLDAKIEFYTFYTGNTAPFENAILQDVDGFVVLIISNDNDAVLNAVKAHIK